MKPKIEYFLKFWGGAEESIAANLGITCQNHYFPTERQRDAFEQAIRCYEHLGLVIVKEQGVLTHKRTVATMWFVYDGHRYRYEYDFGLEYEPKSAAYMFREGNYCCDCNRSNFIRSVQPDFPKMDCGKTIEIVDFKIELRD